MRRLTPRQFLAERELFDEAVESTPEIASFCSRSAWQWAAYQSLGGSARSAPTDSHDESDFFVFERDGHWLAFVERPGARIFLPLESAWMFGCPLLGEPEGAVELLRDVARDRTIGPTGFCVGGVRTDGRLHQALQRLRSGALQWEEFPGTDCMEIDLSDGVEAWRRRRSRKFRRTLRQLRAPELVEPDDFSTASSDEIIDRILAIQRQSWKWREGSDIFQAPDYLAFYTRLIRDLRDNDCLRVIFARDGSRDVAYVMGGIAGDVYRGLQMSYIEEVRDWGVGNWLQLRALRQCCEEGISRYDLGMHAPYKERWADARNAYRVLFVVL